MYCLEGWPLPEVARRFNTSVAIIRQVARAYGSLMRSKRYGELWKGRSVIPPALTSPGPADDFRQLASDGPGSGRAGARRAA